MTDYKKKYEELLAQIDTPLTGDFFESVKNEAIHQRQRWGDAHDENKSDADWFWLLGYLAGKALHDVRGKSKHHIIAAAASLLNWYRWKGEQDGETKKM